MHDSAGRPIQVGDIVEGLPQRGGPRKRAKVVEGLAVPDPGGCIPVADEWGGYWMTLDDCLLVETKHGQVVAEASTAAGPPAEEPPPKGGEEKLDQQLPPEPLPPEPA